MKKNELMTFINEESNKESAENLIDFAINFQQIMILYESGIKHITTKLDTLKQEFKVSGDRSPIKSITSRLKSPQSIAGKLRRQELPLTIESIVKNLNDIAGVRVVCPYIADIYRLVDMLKSQDDVSAIIEKDYIKNPKPNGYRSYHMIVEVPVYLSDGTYPVRVELQIRTIAMDFWASLEHQLKYKSEATVSEEILQELHQCAETIAETDLRMQKIARLTGVLEEDS